MVYRTNRILCIGLLLSVCVVWVLPCFGAGDANGVELRSGAGQKAMTRDELFNLLKTRQAELELEKALAQMERAELELQDSNSLFADNIITVNELRKAEQEFKEARIGHAQAEIQLEQTRLEFLKNATLIRVVDATKFRGELGDVMASIELQNDSDINKARAVMGDAEGGSQVSEDDLRALLKVDNISVTLLGMAHETAETEEWARPKMAMIGDPFQQIIEELKVGQRRALEFRLLNRNVEQVNVQIQYLETVEQYDVVLRKEALQDLPTITSIQKDQQGDLGTTIRYNLQLERLAKTDQTFSLWVLNFPEEVRSAFIEPKTQAKMSTLKFSSEESIRNVDFEVSIPEKLDPTLIDTNISFYIFVARPTETEAIYELKKRFGDEKIPAEEIVKLKSNWVELILVPKGVGKLDILVGNLFKEVQQEQDVVLKFNVMNSGTLAVTRITPELDLPLEWEAELEPREIAVVDPGQKVLVTATVKPPLDVAVGEYVIKVETEGYCGVEIIEAKEKDFTVRVAAVGGLTGTILLVIVLIVLVLGIAIASVKISRR